MELLEAGWPPLSRTESRQKSQKLASSDGVTNGDEVAVTKSIAPWATAWASAGAGAASWVAASLTCARWDPFCVARKCAMPPHTHNPTL